MYLAHVQHRRVNAVAIPKVLRSEGSASLVDADNGFAFPACRLAVEQVLQKAETNGVAMSTTTNSHHFGVAGNHLLPLAEAGMVGLALGNSPAAMPAWGGKRSAMGTNPIAAIFPRRHKAPVLIDLSLSEVARGKIMLASKAGTTIPLGWALDENGDPTTDPNRALSGMMLPVGGLKGAMLALLVELLVTTLTGSHFGAEADSFFGDAGNQPRLGQAFVGINPDKFAGRDVFEERMGTLLSFITQDPEVRIPGERRFQLQQISWSEGIDLPDMLIEQIQKSL